MGGPKLRLGGKFISRRLKLSGDYDSAARRVINHSGEPWIRSIYDRFKNRYQLIYVYKLLKICISIADAAKFKVPKDKYFNKRHKNSNKIFITFYMNDSSISLYNIYKNQGTFPGDF